MHHPTHALSLLVLLAFCAATACVEVPPQNTQDLGAEDGLDLTDAETQDDMETPPDGDQDLGTDANADTAADSDTATDAPEPDQGQADVPPTCTDTCPTLGLMICRDNDVYVCQNDPLLPCRTWALSETCGEGWRCDPEQLTCVEACGDFCEPFSVIVLPDTQYYTNKQSDGANNTYRKQMQWIIDHQAQENIRFVIHVGDITHNNRVSEWTIADGAHAMLDAADIPYSVVTGNHDYLVDGTFKRGGSLFNDYFSPARFAGKAWYGGAFGSGGLNNVTYFSYGDLDFMVLSVEYAPRKDSLCEAEGIIAQHPNHQVIIATHCYTTRGGGFARGCPDAKYNAIGAAGGSIWDELVSRHSNVFLVLCGHIGGSEYGARQGLAGHLVHEILVDYQFEAECGLSSPNLCTNHCRTGTYHGNGWLRQLVFHPRAGRIDAKTLTVEAGNTRFFPQGQPELFCSERFDPPSPDATGGNYYAANPQHQDHVFSFPYDFFANAAYQNQDDGRLAFFDRIVNSVGAGNQLVPKVAAAPSGAFVVVWQDDSDKSDGTGNHDIHARGFFPGGCEAFPDLRVNTNAAGHQASPDIAMDADGNFVVVYADDADGNGYFEIHARGFYADGSERFPRVRVNSVSTGQQLRPAIAMAPDGRFVVAWEDESQGAGSPQIFVRGFNPDGSQRFPDRSVHDDFVGTRVAPALFLDRDARFVVAWEDDSDGNGVMQVHARGFNADGTNRFGRITVNTAAPGQQQRPAIAGTPSGDFVVAWEDDATRNGRYIIMARAFTAAGQERIADFTISATTGTHGAVGLCALDDGAFIATWADDASSAGTFDVRARRYGVDGTPAAPFTVNRVTAGEQRAPGLACTPNGALFVAWEDDMDGNGAFEIAARGFEP